MAGRWSKDGFDDLTVVHCIEGMMPFVKGPDSAESGGDAEQCLEQFRAAGSDETGDSDNFASVYFE